MKQTENNNNNRQQTQIIIKIRLKYIIYKICNKQYLKASIYSVRCTHTHIHSTFWQLLAKNGEFITVLLIMWNSDGYIAFAVVAVATTAVAAAVHSLFACMIIVFFSHLMVLFIFGLIVVRSSAIYVACSIHLCVYK